MAHTDSIAARRYPWLALALSLLAAGVGHIYAGRIAKGLAIFCCWGLLPVLTVIAAMLPPATWVLVALVLVPAALLVLVYFYAAVDAALAAKEAGSAFILREFNRRYLYLLLILLGLVYPVVFMWGVKELAFEAFYIPSDSMNPNLYAGDRVLVNKLMVSQRAPRRGDMVVFREPTAGRNFVQRVMALAGDRIAVQNGDVFVNGEPVGRQQVDGDDPFWFREDTGSHHYLVRIAPHESDPQRLNCEELVVPPRSMFLMGDHRNNSFDSRAFGSVPVADLVGYVQYIYTPAKSWRRFGVIAELQ